MLPLLISMPYAVVGHPGGLPQRLLKPGGQRHAGGALQDIAQQPGAAGRVGPLLPRRMLARQAGDDLAHAGIGAGLRLALGQAGEVRLRVGVVFIPFHTAGVLHQLLQRHAVPGGAFQFGFINGNQIIEGVDLTLLNGDTHQRRDHRFSHRA